MEQCDDGNAINTDACSAVCKLTKCGDFVKQVPNGDGQMEECDDGNLLNGDKCNSICRIGNK